MLHLHDFQMFIWLAVALGIIGVIARGFWLYRASLTWPTADGAITRLDVERRRSGSGGHYFCATFTYDFQANGQALSGTWSKNFSSESDAHDFAARELPVGKAVVVRFNLKDPKSNSLELDSWTYTNDRPTSLNI